MQRCTQHLNENVLVHFCTSLNLATVQPAVIRSVKKIKLNSRLSLRQWADLFMLLNKSYHPVAGLSFCLVLKYVR